MMQNKQLLRKSALTSILLVLLAAVVLEATSLIQYYYAQKGLKNEASFRAEGELENTRIQIADVLDQAEAALRNNVWIAKWCLNHPDSLASITRRIIEDNPVVVGSTVALVPGYYAKAPLMAPYSYRNMDTGEILTKSLATPEYDYPSQEWFVKALTREPGYWSEPYVDEGGGEMLMTTFSVPIKDASGKIGAVLTVDVSLDWLTSMFGDVKVYPSAFSVMASGTGRIMVCPVQSFVMKRTIQDILASLEDTSTFNTLGRDMLSGKSGSKLVRYKGRKEYVYYAPVERTGWSMSIVIPEDEIYDDIRKINWRVRLLQLLGLCMLFFIIRFVARNQIKYKDLSEKREILENELKIASGIQMSMIPSSDSPFPERHDIDMAAVLVPAREVGGDLYDYFIRSGKLFFCIGDVSGKGVPASLVMAVTRSLFRTVSSHEDGPGRIVEIMNNSMSEMNRNSLFVTFFCGVLDLATGQFRYCNAGHNVPVFFSDTKYMLDVVPNLPLGIVSDMSYHEQETMMYEDDAIFLYTDGLTEAENANHELFGEKRMMSVLSHRRNAKDQIQAMEKNVSDFVGSAPQSDDLTMLFIHYLNDGLPRSSVPHIVLRNEVGQISRLAGFVEKVAEENGINPGTTAGINLALEEIVTNVIMYAYPKGTEGFAEIKVRTRDDAIDFEVSDSGKPFDPTAVPEVDINLGAEERKIGGLGIHLARKIMDVISYERKNNKNILTLTKKLNNNGN